jgi:hypothetical protein
MLHIEGLLSKFSILKMAGGGSHRRKGAARQIIDMARLYRSPIPMGRRAVFSFVAPSRRGEGGCVGQPSPCGNKLCHYQQAVMEGVAPILTTAKKLGLLYLLLFHDCVGFGDSVSALTKTAECLCKQLCRGWSQLLLQQESSVFFTYCCSMTVWDLETLS